MNSLFLCSLQWTEVATNQNQELIVRSLLAARDASLEIRLHMREMGIGAGVPVRPPLQNCKYCSLACSKKYIQYHVWHNRSNMDH